MNSPTSIKTRLGKHLLADGMDIIVDLTQSRGSWLVDQRNGDKYLDCFSMFASMAIGFNHDKMVAMRETLAEVAIQKPSNSDAYSAPMAEFMDTFTKLAMPSYLPHVFFIEGGALAVENALKAAFDWKVRKNFSKGYHREMGTKIIHFQQAFHGRSGYTLSLTNTADPKKTCYFPKFSWPRVTNPKLTFPLTTLHLKETMAKEEAALSQIKQAIVKDRDDIAGLIIEPIQGEGGDNHFRDEFFRELRGICDENEILFIMDEVQTGIGLTGKMWAHEHFSVKPDIISFGKKTQVCGVLASKRLDEVSDNVFRESSRINSTFGGNLIDMVRFSSILKIIEEENLVENARLRGDQLLTGLQSLEESYPDQISNARGRGLFCAFDLENTEKRDEFVKHLVHNKLLVVGCGTRSIRFRPHLVIDRREVELVLEKIDAVARKMGN